MKTKIKFDYPIQKTRSFFGLKLKQKSGFNIADIENLIKEIFANLLSQLFSISFKDGKLTFQGRKILFELNNELFTYNVSQLVIESFEIICEEILYRKTGLKFQVKIFSQYIEDLSLEEYIDIAVEACEKVLETGEDIVLPLMSKETRAKIHERLIKFPDIVSKSINSENKRLIVLKRKVKNNK
ncbi:R3H domain-containing nucleic acid-binding protein [Spiroplasma alleghenense]|uniref:R3H domain-containing protein n=1 Tax=Spiroplasma alleghenense TaxID=216931 RepID=A0A345Z5E0_9MOLU|nr:R3H domain-containing nucleic acid-binding protein [Spiroplasma alleghenense]AXK51819.1 hypothetical protein SALLE_v1c11490 [Spiroplasma alleghenense]